MTQVGEAVDAPEFARDEVHTKSTCPWHQKGEKKKKKMEDTDPDDDSTAMPPNDGGTLGRNMTAIKNKTPKADTLDVTYAPGEELTYGSGKKKKTVQTYEETKRGKLYEYPLQYAPHHLIPGNESLKGTNIVKFLGDQDTIAEFAKGKTSMIKEGFSTGYDVNSGKNGAWLPSPYALSMQNEWPSKPGIRVIKRRRSVELADETEDFKEAYVAASIEASGGRQFHMRHNKYSEKVQEILEVIAERMRLMAAGACPLASDSADDDDKLDPPYGVVGRLNVLSENLNRLVTGALWRPPLFTDDMTREYAEDLKQTKRKGRIKKVV